MSAFIEGFKAGFTLPHAWGYVAGADIVGTVCGWLLMAAFFAVVRALWDR